MVQITYSTFHLVILRTNRELFALAELCMFQAGAPGITFFLAQKLREAYIPTYACMVKGMYDSSANASRSRLVRREERIYIGFVDYAIWTHRQ
jgi:hypothetical protein